ncbi:zinc-regulated transporter 2 [Coprinopsis cinerea AmutBmut pab1-1]|nr:zinc-regulated transporter 2 [Coprinopsis cinerea AmutBmut pab1-1]
MYEQIAFRANRTQNPPGAKPTDAVLMPTKTGVRVGAIILSTSPARLSPSFSIRHQAMSALLSSLLTTTYTIFNDTTGKDDEVNMLAPNDTAKLAVMLAILAASLVAVSFPAISGSGLIRTPDLLFFIGKHLGTGVILATAFIHLLPDSFCALLSDAVKKEYGDVGKWTGLIILASLLAIFLVEYISTTYVDRLQAKPSAPSTPAETPSLASTPLPLAVSGCPTPVLGQDPTVILPFLTNTPKILRLHSNVCVCQAGICPGACVCVPAPPKTPEPVQEERQERTEDHHEPLHDHRHHHHHQEEIRVGRRRQIVGIFVLQVGIMIHSLVIGLTLAVTTGADFTSLTTAVLFHQLFEGLSLGIRIAALPPAKHKKDKAQNDEENAQSIESIHSSDDTAVSPIELAPTPQAEVPVPLLAEGSPSSNDSSAPLLSKRQSRDSVRISPRRHQSRPRLRLEWLSWGSVRNLLGRRHAAHKHDHHHQHHHASNGYGSTSASTQVHSHDHHHDHHHHRTWISRLNPLKTILSLLFAVTTPAGMAIGMVVLKNQKSSEEAPLKLIQGLMSAVSAGMLIYVATVEMIAGDFVFGDVEGGHHHGPGHHHHHHHHHDHHHHDAHGHGEGRGDEPEDEPRPASLAKKALAVVSLLAGVTAMVLIGLSE